MLSERVGDGADLVRKLLNALNMIIMYGLQTTELYVRAFRGAKKTLQRSPAPNTFFTLQQRY